MGRRQRAVSAPPRKSLRGRKSGSVSDQQFEERRRTAERLVQALREVGYSCELGDDGPARSKADIVWGQLLATSNLADKQHDASPELGVLEAMNALTSARPSAVARKADT